MIVQEHARGVAGALEGWADAPEPLYLALADALERAVGTGRIASHLPSERALAAALHVSRGTVVSAYDVLRQRGVVERQRGSGSVARPARAHEVCADPIACVQAFFAGRTAM